jgi:hypothetical protein
MIRLTIRGEQSLYRDRRVPCDPDVAPAAFQFQKLTAEHAKLGSPYSLHCSSNDPAEAVITCDCLGFQASGTFCRHADSLRVLLTRRPK